jgi:DNA polymerase (family 10)
MSTEKLQTAAQQPDNYAIADQFSLLAKLMDIHGENAFKAKSYSSAAFTIEKLPQQLALLPEKDIYKVKGLGESAGKKVWEILQSGGLKALEDLIQQTPPGVLEMMNIKGLGPKKINVIWKEMHIDTIEELESACRENRIAAKKGFGEKTEQKILEAIAFAQQSKGLFLYKQVEDFALALQTKLAARFPQHQVALAGEFRRQLEVISKLEWITTVPKEQLKAFVLTEDAEVLEEADDVVSIRAGGYIDLHFYFSPEQEFAKHLFERSSSEEFLCGWKEKFPATMCTTEEEFFTKAGIPFIPAYLREKAGIIEKINSHTVEDIIQPGTIKGLIHSHSNWSDGSYTIEQMAEELIRQGFEYLVISDHSKAAAYANGLSEEKIKAQHQYIDSLNQKFAPFKIFKSIECDILGDGSLDYDNETLASFDLVITSIHSNLDMDEEKAMARLLKAISHPYATILGHMTGRLLLRRKGYPIDHKAVIDACAANQVVIEINASPSRLDMDWRWINYALEQNVLLSVNPDAHALEEFGYIKYGTLVAQKGGLPASKNLSSFSRQEFETFLQEVRTKKGQKIQ